jgi:deoxycytidylate deaminase/dephospho-CoA kinase
MANVSIARVDTPSALGPRSRSEDLIRAHAANELIFAVVGHVGSGTSQVAKSLKKVLETPELAGGAFDATILKARDEIEAWARKRGRKLPEPSKTIAHARELQDLGDEMRKEHGDHAAVACQLARKIRETRAHKQGIPLSDPKAPVLPDGARRAYILDAIRHPAEIHLLRSIYQSAFTLIGVVCEEEKRVARLGIKYSDGGHDNVRKFMARDAKAPEKHGQRVSDAFHMADVFIDNSEEMYLKDLEVGEGLKETNPAWDIPDHLERLVAIITHARIERPTSAETAMYHAFGAMMRSACLSRQVGAALIDRYGNLIATGTNEVPRAGGGVYGTRTEGHGGDDRDERCARRSAGKYCSNTMEQNVIIDELIGDLIAAQICTEGNRVELRRVLRDSRIGGLLEFSRAVHAEMDALLTAGRKGASTVGTRAFVTTFPCHYCARHLVSAGVDEIQYIEPYPKSRAFKLHSDAITPYPQQWRPPSEGGKERRVLCRPFTGIAPRMYRRAFLKDREYKNPETGVMDFGEPPWEHPWHLGRASYVELEATIAASE